MKNIKLLIIILNLLLVSCGYKTNHKAPCYGPFDESLIGANALFIRAKKISSDSLNHLVKIMSKYPDVNIYMLDSSDHYEIIYQSKYSLQKNMFLVTRDSVFFLKKEAKEMPLDSY